MINNCNLHYYLIREIIFNGYAPNNKVIAKHFDTSLLEVEKTLYSLQEYHGVVLHPNKPKVWVIHPFSLAPTNFYIKSKKGQWWGNCAWCSLGIATLVDSDLTISTAIGGEDKPLTIHIKDGEILEKNLFIHFPIPMKKAWDNVIYTCSTMLIFENEMQVEDWSLRHNIPQGDIQPIEKIWEFSKTWYGDHLNPEWSKWTMEEAKEMFTQFELNHPIWDLEGDNERF